MCAYGPSIYKTSNIFKSLFCGQSGLILLSPSKKRLGRLLAGLGTEQHIKNYIQLNVHLKVYCYFHLIICNCVTHSWG